MPRVPKYETTQVTPQVARGVEAPDLGSSYARAKAGDEEVLGVVKDFIDKEVQRGKQIAVENYKLQMDASFAELQNKVLARQRKDALGAVEFASNEWQNVLNGAENIGLGDVRDEVSAYGKAKLQGLQELAMRHERSEMERLDHETFAGRNTLTQGTIALAADDDSLFANAVNDTVDRTTKYAERHGIPTTGTPEETSLFVEMTQEEVGKLYVSRVQNLVDAGNFAKAQEAFDNAKQDKNVNAQQLKYLNDLLEQGKKKQGDDLIERIAVMVDEGRRKNPTASMDDIVPKWMQQQAMLLSPNKFRAVKNFQYAQTNDWNAYSDAMELASKDPDKFRTMSPADLRIAYGDKLDKESFNKLLALQQKMNGVGGSGGTDIKQVMTDNAAVRSMIATTFPELNKKYSDLTEAEKLKRENLLAAGSLAIDAARKDPTKKMDPLYRNEVLRKAFSQTAYIDKPWYKGWDKKTTIWENFNTPFDPKNPSKVYIPQSEIKPEDWTGAVSETSKSLVSKYGQSALDMNDPDDVRFLEEMFAASAIRDSARKMFLIEKRKLRKGTK